MSTYTSSSLSPQDRNPLSVSQLNRQAKRLLEGHFQSVWVEGEISNLARPSSGHWYFSLKDNSAQIKCAMFRSSNARLRFNVEAGQQVMVRAKLSLYEARGDYQLIVEHMEPAGDGALAKAFEALKAKLQAEGLFDPDHKQDLPTIPQHIAVITSSTGAAIRDILIVLARRFAGIPVTIVPVAVQGRSAGMEIATAIARVNQLAASGQFDFDVILTGRGGGSLEDLWAFNEEIVARAIYDSTLPVVSAVGHEVDFTIADFVADVRAATPSAAAELLSPDGEDLLNTFAGYRQLLTQRLGSTLQHYQQKVDWLRARLRHPGSRLLEHHQRLDELEIRLGKSWQRHLQQAHLRLQLIHSQLQQHTPDNHIQRQKLSVASLYKRLERQILQQLEKQHQRLRSSMHLLNTVSPLATLDRGYAIVTDEQGQIVRDTSHLTKNQSVKTRLGRGTFTSTISSTKAD